MRVIATNDEIQKYVDFEEWLRKNPCLDDACGTVNVSACLGCSLLDEWRAKQPSGMETAEYYKGGLLTEYAMASHDYAEAVREKEAAEDRLNKARQKFDEIRSKIVVE